MANLRFTNFVASADLGHKIDLVRLCRTYTNTIYKPAKFSGLNWRHKNIEGTCLVFKSGKIVVNGIKNKNNIRKCVRQYARLIQKCEVNVKLRKIMFVTSSACYMLAARVDYVKMAKAINTSLEPELFHALRVHRDKVHFIIYSTGKVIITGITSKNVLDTVVYPFLLELEINV